MRKCILYAEDDQEDFMLLKKAFEDIDRHDIEIVNVVNGYGVIRTLQELEENCYPSLILMELNMPLLNGRETLELLKLDDKFKNIPVIILSTFPSPSEEKFIRSRGLEFIHKPSLYSDWLTIAKNLSRYCYFFFLCTDLLLQGF
jgi:CheY-like chemotaxis protein